MPSGGPPARPSRAPRGRRPRGRARPAPRVPAGLSPPVPPSRAPRGGGAGCGGALGRAAPARSRRGGGGDGGGSPAAQAHIRVLAATRRGDVTRWRGQHGGGKNERPSPAGPRWRAAGGRRGPARVGPVAPLPTCCPAGRPGRAPRNLVGWRGSVGLEALGRRLRGEERARAPVRKPPVAQLRRPARPPASPPAHPRGPRTSHSLLPRTFFPREPRRRCARPRLADLRSGSGGEQADPPLINLVISLIVCR